MVELFVGCMKEGPFELAGFKIIYTTPKSNFKNQYLLAAVLFKFILQRAFKHLIQHGYVVLRGD